MLSMMLQVVISTWKGRICKNSREKDVDDAQADMQKDYQIEEIAMNCEFRTKLERRLGREGREYFIY
jgi:hypothetical protein